MQFMLSRWCSLLLETYIDPFFRSVFFEEKKAEIQVSPPSMSFAPGAPRVIRGFAKHALRWLSLAPLQWLLAFQWPEGAFLWFPQVPLEVRSGSHEQPGFLYFPIKWHAKGHNKVRVVETPTSWFQWVMEGLMISSMISSPTLGKFQGKKGFKPAFDLRFFGWTSCMFQLLFPYFLTVILSTSWNMLRLRFLFGKVAYISRCRFLLSEIA